MECSTFFLMILFLLQNTFFKCRDLSWDGAVRYLSYAVLYSYLIAWLVGWCRSRLLKILLYVFFSLVCAVNIFLYLHFKSSISPGIILLLAETNANESSEFLTTYLLNLRSLFAYGIIGCMIAAIVFVEKIEQHLKIAIGIIYKNFVIKYLLWFVLLVGVLSHYTYYYFFQCRSTVEVDEWVSEYHAKPMDNVSNLIFCAYDLYLAQQEQGVAIASTERALQRDAFSDADSLNVVVVIGESYVKWHSSLYGYSLNTTPQMLEEQQRGNLFVFDNVFAPYNLTSKVLRNVFSCNSLGNAENWYDYPSFPALFKKASYEVLFWDNQYDPTSKESFDFSLNSYIHNPAINGFSYSFVNKKKYEHDGEMLTTFLDSFNRLIGKTTLSIFHLMGQHIAYYNRFPHNKQFLHFNKDSVRRSESWMSDEKRQLIADYDNATYYNDFFMKQLFDYFRYKKTVLVYFSDHGEEVYDYQNYAGRRHDKFIDSNLLKYQYAVPFVVWCSDKYMTTNPSQVEKIKRAVNRPLMLDNVCHMLFSLAQIDTPYYIPGRDILDSTYSCPPRIVNDSINIEKLLR